jgi:hypothetical protein
MTASFYIPSNSFSANNLTTEDIQSDILILSLNKPQMLIF